MIQKLKSILFALVFLPLALFATEEKPKVFLPTPLIAADGSYSVGCRNKERIPLRWPVLKYTRTVIDNFQSTFINLRDTESPLYIELGTSTSPEDTRVRYRSIRTEWGFSQLVIVIPNPDVVDLDILRAAIVEGLLRERCRKQTGAYSNFKWPKWFIQGMADASLGSLWKANAYEKVFAEYKANQLPTLEALFNESSPNVSREVAAFFALWVLQIHTSSEERTALIHAPWQPQTILSDAFDEKKWQAWIEDFEDHIFLPGAITKRQFERWQTTLVLPTTKEQALEIIHSLTRMSTGRPMLFRELSALYMESYLAWMNEDYDSFISKRKTAEDSAAILTDHFTRSTILIDESTTPSIAPHQHPKWNSSK